MGGVDEGELGGERDPRPDGLHPLVSRRMEERALRERWPLPDKVRVQVLKRVCGMVDPESEEGQKAKRREVLGAARVLIAADRLNLEQRRLDLAEGTIAEDRVDVDLVAEAEAIRERRRARRERAESPAG
jgi:hypothetical protein